MEQSPYQSKKIFTFWQRRRCDWSTNSRFKVEDDNNSLVIVINGSKTLLSCLDKSSTGKLTFAWSVFLLFEISWEAAHLLLWPRERVGLSNNTERGYLKPHNTKHSCGFWWLFKKECASCTSRRPKKITKISYLLVKIPLRSGLIKKILLISFSGLPRDTVEGSCLRWSRYFIACSALKIQI